MNRIARPLVLVALSLGAVARAGAAEFLAYRATISLILQSASYDVATETDTLFTHRLSSKSLINLASGQPLKTKVPSQVVLAVLVPKAGPPYSAARLVVFDTAAGTVLQTVAGVQSLSSLSAGDGAPAVGIGQGSVPGFANGELDLSGFSVAAGGTARFTDASESPGLDLSIKALHGRFMRNSPPPNFTPFYYAGVMPKGRLRARGRPIATVNL